MFYPDMADVLKSDRQLFEFLQQDSGDPFEGKEIDPDNMTFQNPDFGFNNSLIFEDITPNNGKYSSSWKYIMDYTTLFPRFERVTNYIQFVNQTKL